VNITLRPLLDTWFRFPKVHIMYFESHITSKRPKLSTKYINEPHLAELNLERLRYCWYVFISFWN